MGGKFQSEEKKAAKAKHGKPKTQKDERLTGLILLLLGGFLLAGQIKSRLDLPAELKLAQSAVYVENGEVLPENEGKLVIVSGTIKQDGVTRDPLMGLTFDVPVLYRVVESYELDSTIGDGVWRWEKQYSSRGDELACGYVHGNVTLGSFILSEEVLCAFPTDTGYDRFHEEEVAAAGVMEQETGGTVYLSADTDIGRGSTFSILGLLGNGGTRISYRCYDTSQTPTATIIGYQNGNSLTLTGFDEISFSDVMAGTLSKKEFLKAASDETTEGSLLIGIPSALACLLGLYWILRYYTGNGLAS